MLPFIKSLLRTLPSFSASHTPLQMFNRLRRKGFRERLERVEGYVSQDGQDVFLDRQVFRGRRGGCFVDIGANDGITFSNTWFFEKAREWKGICVEPQPNIFKKLQSNRQCPCLQGCVTDVQGTAEFLHVQGIAEMGSGLCSKYDARHLVRIEREVKANSDETAIIEVPCFTFAQVLAMAELSHIDYLSIDTEGGELDILRSVDFGHVPIHVISVENCFHNGLFEHLLRPHGYSLRAIVGADDIYIHRDFRP